MVLDAVKEERKITANPSTTIDTIIIYLDEITNLTSNFPKVFYNLSAGFIKALKKVELRRAIVLTDTNASITDLLPHEKR